MTNRTLRLRYSLAVHPIFRLLLICLLAVALPLKALAAVAMVGCGPVHHGARGNVEAPVVVAAHDHGSHASSDHHHASVAEQAPGEDGKHHGAKLAKCSSCAPCCAAAAPAPDPLRFAGMETATDELPSATATYRGVVGDVPHKPPRLFLA